MKRLILMRHAKSDWSGAASSDHERPLNARGIQSATALGIWLASKEYQPDTVLCSTAARTRETLALLKLGNNPDLQFNKDLYLATAEQLLTVLRNATGRTVLLIAHNPGIARMAQAIVASTEDIDGIRQYPTGATMVTAFDIDSWNDLVWKSGRVIDTALPRNLPSP